MITRRIADERGHVNMGWLNSRHSFSFGSYYDPKHMGFRSLRVINDDAIAGGGGFDTHPHRDMEIITFVTEGALEHQDTLGNHSVIKPGEIQIMSAGKGIFHSERNHFEDKTTSLFQIWILPNETGVEPRYDQFNYESRKVKNGLTLLVSPEGVDQVAYIHADASLRLGEWEAGHEIDLKLDPSRSYWLQMTGGSINFDGDILKRGDALAMQELQSFQVSTEKGAQFLLFDLA